MKKYVGKVAELRAKRNTEFGTFPNKNMTCKSHGKRTVEVKKEKILTLSVNMEEV